MHPALERRAIHDAYVSGRWGDRYVPFERDDWGIFEAGHSHPEKWHRSIVRQAGGLIVNRWDVTGEELVPYVRPDHEVHIPGHRKASKYLQPSARLYPGQSKRLDVHPLVRERLLQDAEEPIYLCLEGSLKADALAGTGRLAISVPSVTLWEVREEHLAPWLPILRRAPVIYVVPDSDYHPKRRGYGTGEQPVFVNGGEVRFFTDRCVIHYRRKYGLPVRYLVPPYLSLEEAKIRGIEPGGRWKIGIDDHIAWGRSMEPWNAQTNPLGLHDFEYVKKLYRRLPPKKRGRGPSPDPRDRALLDHLESTRGTCSLFSMTDVARELGWNRDTVLKARKSCAERGALEVWPGRPLGLQNGNKPHVYRFGVPYEIKGEL